MTTMTKTEQQEAKANLLRYLQPGDTVYCILRHVSRSGMLRRIDLYTFKDNWPVFLSGYACNLMGWSRGKSYSDPEGIRISGAGMDMGFHLVYELSGALFPDNAYALKHEWI